MLHDCSVLAVEDNVVGEDCHGEPFRLGVVGWEPFPTINPIILIIEKRSRVLIN